VSSWTRVSYDLCALSGNACVQFRLRYDPRFDGPPANPVQFAVDNFQLIDNKRDVETINISGCFGPCPHELDVTFRYNGPVCTTPGTLSSVDLTYEVNGAPTTITLTGLNVAAGQSYTHTFTNVSVPGQSSRVRAWVARPNGLSDLFVQNDTLRANLASFPNCNDNCVCAQELRLGTTTTSQTTIATTAVGEDPSFSSCSTPSGGLSIENTVWYSFTTDATGGTAIINFTNIAPSIGTRGIQVEISEVTGPDPCTPSDRNPIFCSSTESLADVSYDFGGGNLLPNRTYMIAVDGFSGTDATFDVTLVGTAILPVEGLFLTGKWLGNTSTELSWSTTREVNNKHFELERRPEGQTAWKRVTTIDGVGNSSTLQRYGHLDQGLLDRSYYYRIRQVDFDGAAIFSNTILLSRDGGAENHIGDAYPNPNNGEFQIPVVITRPTTINLKLLNALGQEVWSSQMQLAAGAYNLPVSTAIAHGVYLLQVKLGSDNLNQKLHIH
ncbi:MAG: T9SS type A sorting domain-containing protein, partial [Sphingobacteriia bacterium]